MRIGRFVAAASYFDQPDVIYQGAREWGRRGVTFIPNAAYQLNDGDAVIDAARSGGAAADTLIARYFATRRYAGSKDRRAVRDLVYAAIRQAGRGE